MMKKDMFFIEIQKINKRFIGTLCEGNLAKKRLAENEFGDFAYINEKGEVVIFMHEFEPEDYVVFDSEKDFLEKTVFYSLEEVMEILEKENSNKQEENISDTIIDLYKAMAIIGKDFIDKTYIINGNKYNASEALRNHKITQEEMKKMRFFLPKYLKEAKKVNENKKKAFNKKD